MEADTDEQRHTSVERPPRHHVDGVGSADADRDHAETARVGRVTVGPEHHPAGERVLLEHDLVDDPRARLPEPDAIFRRHRAQELVDLGVHVECVAQVGVGADARLDEVVAVHGRGHLYARESGGHELQERHLRGRVLHRHPVRAVIRVVGTALGAHHGRVVGVGEEDFLGERQRPPEAPPSLGHRARELGIDGFDELDGRGGPDALRHGALLRSYCTALSRRLAGYAVARFGHDANG